MALKVTKVKVLIIDNHQQKTINYRWKTTFPTEASTFRFEHDGWWWFVNYLNCKLCLIYCRNNVLVYNKWPKKRVFTVLHCLCTSCRGSLCVLQADELEYTFKRLVDGLAHTREAARPGFSLALGQVSRIYLWSCICRYLNCTCDKIMSSQRFTD